MGAKPYNVLYTGQPFAVSPNRMGRCTIARHDSRNASRAPRNFSTRGEMPSAINMGLADGHAGIGEARKPVELLLASRLAAAHGQT